MVLRRDLLIVATEIGGLVLRAFQKPLFPEANPNETSLNVGGFKKMLENNFDVEMSGNTLSYINNWECILHCRSGFRG